MHGPGDVRFFDRVARVYDLAMLPADEASLAAGLDCAERPIEVALDLGGGTGRAALALPPGVEAVVLDRSRGMLDRARGRGLETIRGDARRLPLSDGAVDAVTVVDALHHLPEHRRVLAEAARVLAPGGVLVVREFDPATVAGRLLRVTERLAGMGSTFVTPDDLAARIDEAGLCPTVVERGFGYTVAGVKGTTH